MLDRLNLLDMQLTAMRSNNAALSAAVEAEQGRCNELEAALAARERVGGLRGPLWRHAPGLCMRESLQLLMVMVMVMLSLTLLLLLLPAPQDIAEGGRCQLEAQAKLEKAMEQMIAANTAKEHARQKVRGANAGPVRLLQVAESRCLQRVAMRSLLTACAACCRLRHAHQAADEAAKVSQLLAERAQLLAEREKRLQDYQLLKQKYAQKSGALKEVRAQCSVHTTRVG